MQEGLGQEAKIQAKEADDNNYFTPPQQWLNVVICIILEYCLVPEER